MDPSENSFFPIQHYILKFTFADVFVTTAWYPALRVEFSRQEYWSELSFPSLGDLPDPGIESGSPAFQANTVSFLYFFKNFFFSLFIYFSIEGQLLYNILLVSVIHQHESATGIHVSLPLEPLSHLPLHPTPLGCHSLAMSLSTWDLSSLTRDQTHILCTGSSES